MAGLPRKGSVDITVGVTDEEKPEISQPKLY